MNSTNNILGMPTHCELCEMEYRHIGHPLKPGVIMTSECDCTLHTKTTTDGHGNSYSYTTKIPPKKMITHDQAISAKEKFKAEYWSKNPEKYNVVMIGVDIMYDETNFNSVFADKDEECPDIILDQQYYVKVFLFDMANAEELPNSIDGVEIRYLPVMEK